MKCLTSRGLKVIDQSSIHPSIMVVVPSASPGAGRSASSTLFVSLSLSKHLFLQREVLWAGICRATGCIRVCRAPLVVSCGTSVTSATKPTRPCIRRKVPGVRSCHTLEALAGHWRASTGAAGDHELPSFSPGESGEMAGFHWFPRLGLASPGNPGSGMTLGPQFFTSLFAVRRTNHSTGPSLPRGFRSGPLALFTFPKKNGQKGN